MKNNSVILFLTITSLLLGSCSKESKPAISKVETINHIHLEEDSTAFKLWESLFSSARGNLALPEYLAMSVYNENKKYIDQHIKPLSLEEMTKVIEVMNNNSSILKNDFLFYGSKFKNDKEFLNKTLINLEEKTSGLSFEQQFIMNSAASLKKQLLQNIFTIYDQRIAENSSLIADYIMNDINVYSPALRIKLENTAQKNPSKLLALINESLPTVKKYDLLFKNSNLNQDEQLTTLLIGVVASKIHDKLQDKKTFKEILKVYQDIKDVALKVDEVKVLLTGINEYQREMKNDYHDLGVALKGLGKDSQALFELSSKYDPIISGKKINKFLYNSVFIGKPIKNDESNPSILSKQISLNDNFVTVVNKAEKLNNNFNIILDSTERISKILHVELPSGVKKAIETTKKASAVFSTANMILDGLKKGGVMGAMSALSSGPAMKLLGLNPDPDAAFKNEVLSRLGIIDQKLDDVLLLQKQTIQIQIETMTMIKEIAIIVDAQHRETMDLLSDIRDTSLTNLEINKVALNSQIRSCEILLNYQLNSIPNLQNYKSALYEDMRSLDLDIQKFKNSFNTFSDIQDMFNSTAGRGFENCISGLNQAFGLINVKENPIRAIYASNENENLLKFQREKYIPLFKKLKELKKENVFFHMPVTKFSSLFQKYIYMKNEETERINEAMTDFISTRALERSTSQLLVFYPFIDLKTEEWTSGLENVLNLGARNTEINKNSSAYYLLRNNLTLVQTAIAQEALLSGELIFDQLKTSQHSLFLENITTQDELAYAVVSNRLLMKNFIIFLIKDSLNENSRDLTLQGYDQFLKAKNISSLEQFFENRILQNSLTIDDSGQVSIKLAVNGKHHFFPLPSLSDLDDDLIHYSANMYRLLELQKRVLDALKKVSPNNFSQEHKKKMGVMMIQ